MKENGLSIPLVVRESMSTTLETLVTLLSDPAVLRAEGYIPHVDYASMSAEEQTAAANKKVIVPPTEAMVHNLAAFAREWDERFPGLIKRRCLTVRYDPTTDGVEVRHEYELFRVLVVCVYSNPIYVQCTLNVYFRHNDQMILERDSKGITYAEAFVWLLKWDKEAWV